MKQRLILACILAFPLVALATADAHAQGRPLIFRDELDDTVTAGFCGFPMRIRTTGTGVFHLFLDENGDVEQAIVTAAGVRLSFTNLVTGESIWTPSVNMTKSTVGVGTGTQSYRGLLWRLVIPHEGLVTADVGRIDFLFTLDAQGNVISEEIVFIAGQQENQFLPALCAALST